MAKRDKRKKGKNDLNQQNPLEQPSLKSRLVTKMRNRLVIKLSPKRVYCIKEEREDRIDSNLENDSTETKD